jgi:phage-related minor tail protein
MATSETNTAAVAERLSALSSEAWQTWATISAVYDATSGQLRAEDTRALNQLGWLATAAEAQAKRLAEALDDLREGVRA